MCTHKCSVCLEFSSVGDVREGPRAVCVCMNNQLRRHQLLTSPPLLPKGRPVIDQFSVHGKASFWLFILLHWSAGRFRARVAVPTIVLSGARRDTSLPLALLRWWFLALCLSYISAQRSARQVLLKEKPLVF